MKLSSSATSSKTTVPVSGLPDHLSESKIGKEIHCSESLPLKSLANSKVSNTRTKYGVAGLAFFVVGGLCAAITASLPLDVSVDSSTGHYCAVKQEHVPSVAWMIFLLAACHGCALKFLEEYCFIVPPPKIDNEKERKKRPAVYLLKIPFLLWSAYLLLPVVVEFYIPNIIKAAKVLASRKDSEFHSDFSFSF